MKVEWTKDATRQKDQVAEYVREEFGYKRKRKFVQDVDKAARMLKRAPNIGQIDPLFANHAATYRSIIINGTTQLIDDHVQAFQTDNQVFNQKRSALHQARLGEDEVWLKSQRDAVVPLLDAADKRQDGYISAARYILTGHAGNPQKW